MTNFELIFTMLGEDATRQMTEIDNAQGFAQNQESAISGGRAAGRALKAFEEDKKIKVVSADNFLGLLSEDTTKPLPSDDNK